MLAGVVAVVKRALGTGAEAKAGGVGLRNEFWGGGCEGWLNGTTVDA